MTAVTCPRPFEFDATLASLRFDWIEKGLDIEYFHAADDRQAVRDTVFAVIQSQLQSLRIDSIIIEKRKTAPSLQAPDVFYPRMIGYLLRHVFASVPTTEHTEVIVMTDRIPVTRKRRAVEKGVKTTLHEMLPPGSKFRLLHHDSKSCTGLQVADYCNWAIYRARDRDDHRSRDLIKPSIRSEFDIFQYGTKLWY